MDTLLADDLSFPIMPDHHPQVVFAEDEDFVVGQWNLSLEEEKRADSDDEDRMSTDDLLEIDRQIGSRFLDAELFGAESGPYCESPIGPVEELLIQFDKNEHHQFLAPFLMSESVVEDADAMMMDDEEEEDELDTVGLSFEERYKVTLQKLAFSMKKSQETRKSLTMKTTKTEQYDRLASVKKILTSVATSSDQVQSYVTSIQRHRVVGN
jgi:hypothetical protein